MKFRWEAASPYGGSALHATAQDYDGHPRPGSLALDFSPRFSTPEVIAAASVLAFGGFVSGVVDLASPIRPETAGAIADFLRPGHVNIGSIDYTPKAISYPAGTFLLRADDAHVDVPFQDVNGGRAIALRLVSTGRGFSFNYTSDEIVVPTNADTLAAATAGSGVDRTWLPRLAVAVLLAADYDIGFVRLPPEVAQTELLRRAGAVMRSAGVGLQFAVDRAIRNVT